MAVGFGKSKGVPVTDSILPVGMSVESTGGIVARIDLQSVVVDGAATLAVEVEIGVVGQVEDGGFVGSCVVADPKPVAVERVA